MTELPTWWLVMVLACIILLGAGFIVLLSFLMATLNRLQALLNQLSDTGLPRTILLAEQVSHIASTAQRVVETIDQQTLMAAPKVQQIIERVDEAAEKVASSSETINHTIDDTAHGLQALKSNPLTPKVLLGVGGVVAAGFIKAVFFNGPRKDKRKKSTD